MSKKRTTIPLISGLVILGVCLGVVVASASGGARLDRSSAKATNALVYYKPAAARTRPRAVRFARIKVLGYKHAPGQEAAIRAAEARSYLRRVAGEKADPALVDRFRLLRTRRAHAATDAARGATASADTTVVTAISGLIPLGATYGADPSQARETTVGPGQARVWLVPGDAGACIVNVEGPQGAGSTCNSTSAVDGGRLWTLDTMPYGAGGAKLQVLLGAAPDGNASITVSWTGGGTTVVPVTGNIYSVPIGAHTGWQSVTLKNSAGVAVTIPGIPNLP